MWNSILVVFAKYCRNAVVGNNEKNSMKKLLFIPFIFLIQNLFSQNQNIVDANAVKTIDGTINESLKIITGERGKNRNWEAYRMLFTPNAQITYLHHDTAGKITPFTSSLEEFVRNGRNYYENDGFIEYELKKQIIEYNGIANAFQSYYAKENEHEEIGVNSYQLIWDGKRWWITNILWTNNSNGMELPDNLKK
jgi:hypothetical protein